MPQLKLLVGLNAGEVFEVRKEETLLGRRSDCDIVIASPSVSREHARILLDSGEFFLEDLGSTNGTYLNDERVVGRTALNEGDRIKINRVEFAFERASDESHAPGLRISEHEAEPEFSGEVHILEEVPAGRATLQAGGADGRIAPLLQILQGIANTVSTEQLLPKLVDGMLAIFPQADRAFVLLTDRPGGPLQLKAMRCRSEEDERATIRPISRTVSNLVMSEGKAILSADAAQDQRFEESPSVFDCAIHSMMCAPLALPDAEPIGVLQVDSAQGLQQFRREDLDLLASVAGLAAGAISHRRVFEQHLESERLASIGKAVTRIVHEGRNALNVIQLSLERVGRAAAADPEILETILPARRSILQLQQLFGEVRSFSAPLILEYQDVNLAEIWRQAWCTLEPLWCNREAELVEPTDTAHASCRADAFRLEQVFRNLLENSLRIVEGPVVCTLSCRPVQLGDTPAVQVTIRDNGPGIPADDCERIFDALFTTRPEGSGLGLAIVRRLVEAHGGTIVARPNPRGAVFHLTLPLESPAKPNP